MNLQSFKCGPYETNAYVLSCSKTNACVIIDPAPESFHSIVEYIEKNAFSPTHILLTHSHFDHIGDLAKTKEYYKIPVLVHEKDKDNILDPGCDGIPFFMEIPPCEIDAFLSDQQEINVGELKLRVIHLPGHSPGGVGFYIEEKHTLIAGDTLFRGSIGNMSLPTSKPADMKQSLKKLAQLPSKTLVCSGHGQTTTIGNEPWLSQPERLFPDLI